MPKNVERIQTTNSTEPPTGLSGVTVTGSVNPTDNTILFYFSSGSSAVYDHLNYPVVRRDGSTPGQLNAEDQALRTAINHVTLLDNASDAAGQQAYANMIAGFATELLALNTVYGSNGTAAQPSLPDGTTVAPITVTALRSSLTHGSWVIDATAGQPGGVGINVYDPATGQWSVHITPKAINDYAAQDGGLPYLIGHEIGHDSSGGLAAQTYFYNAYNADELSHGVSYGPDSYNWVNNEVYANIVAQNITNLVGLPFLHDPTYGLVFH